MSIPELPLGLGMAMAQNPQAMSRFCAMSPERQRQVIARTHSIRSKREMHQFVAQLGEETNS